jgi:hypothetical protein
MNQLKRLNLKGQIQNEIGFSYLGQLGGVHLNLVKVIAYIALAYFRLLYIVASYRLLDLGLRVEVVGSYT